MRRAGVRTVVWATPWVNLDSRDGHVPPQPESERLHREPAPRYGEAAAAGHFVQDNGRTFVTQWWMGTGSPVDFTSAAAEEWWRSQVKRVLALGVEGIKVDDGDGYTIPDGVRLADGRSGASAAWALGGLHRLSLQRALDEVHPGSGVVFGRSGWAGQQATGLTWGGDQVSDFWSLRALVVATLSAACSGISNWSHDIGGYLGYGLVERCAHEQLVPYVRAAAATAARTGLPIIRPLCLIDPADARGWTIGDAYGFGQALWVAPVLDDGAGEREVALPRGEWIETRSGDRVSGGSEIVVEAPLERIPVWVRAGSIVVTYPPEHVAAGLGDTPESERPLIATLWGEPRLGHAAARLADGTHVAWGAGRWSASPDRDVEFRVRDV